MADKKSDGSVSGSSVGRTELADKVYRAAPGLTRSEARDLVDVVLAEIVEGLAADGKVLLTGFGHFALNTKVARVGRNPKTGQEYPIAARRVVSFRPAAQVRRAVAQASAAPFARTPCQATMKMKASAARQNETPA